MIVSSVMTRVSSSASDAAASDPVAGVVVAGRGGDIGGCDGGVLPAAAVDGGGVAAITGGDGGSVVSIQCGCDAVTEQKGIEP